MLSYVFWILKQSNFEETAFESFIAKQYDKYNLHSENVYQIYTYMKNQDKNNTGKVQQNIVVSHVDLIIVVIWETVLE